MPTSSARPRTERRREDRAEAYGSSREGRRWTWVYFRDTTRFGDEVIQLRTTGRSTHIIVSCPDDSCGGNLFFWPEARTDEGNVVADCCGCARRFSLSHGRLSELARSPGWYEELA